MPRYEVVWPKGIGFRTEPRLESKAEDRIPAKRGEVFVGQAFDGWVCTEEGLYLPLEAPDGKPLLKKLANFIPWAGGADNEAAQASAAPEALMSFGGRGSRPASGGRGGFAASGQGLPPRPPAGPPAAAPGAGGLDELAHLHQKYDKKYGRPRGVAATASYSASAAPMFGSAATSHERNTAYMHEMRDNLEEMGMDTRDDAYLNTYAPKAGAVPAVRRPSRNSGAALASNDSRDRLECNSSRPDSRGSSTGSRGAAGPRSSSGSRGRRTPGALAVAGSDLAGAAAGGSAASGATLALCGAMMVTRSAGSGCGRGWREGPANAIVAVQEWTSVKHGREVRNTGCGGRIVDVSDRNVMCMSVLGEKAVLGSADHGLKELNLRAGQVTRTLYTKRCGHTEWVTTVSHCPDGRVISGGMDSKLCLWNTSGAVCVDLTGHMGSVSRVRTHAHQNVAISSSYDRSLRCWDLRSKTEVAHCTGHDAPILDFIWADDMIASGDRSGAVRIWDAACGQHIGKLNGHKGHITAMLALPASCAGAGGGVAAAPGASGGSASLIATGAQDGHIRIWDLRQKLNTFNMAAHTGGAVNEIGVTLGSSPPVLVSVGADGRLLVLDPRANFQPLFEFAGVTEDFIYSLLVLDDIAYTGDGRGKVTCFDVRTGQQRYTLDAGENGIRCMGASESTLICAGDDGNAVMFDF